MERPGTAAPVLSQNRPNRQASSYRPSPQDAGGSATDAIRVYVNTKTLVKADADALINREEDHFYDKKASAIAGKKVQKIAVALANADGGDFVIGIADEKEEPDPSKRWFGASTIEELNCHFQALMEVKPGLPMEATLLKTVAYPGFALLVRIEKSPALHATADGTVYIRRARSLSPLRTHNV